MNDPRTSIAAEKVQAEGDNAHRRDQTSDVDDLRALLAERAALLLRKDGEIFLLRAQVQELQTCMTQRLQKMPQEVASPAATLLASPLASPVASSVASPKSSMRDNLSKVCSGRHASQERAQASQLVSAPRLPSTRATRPRLQPTTTAIRAGLSELFGGCVDSSVEKVASLRKLEHNAQTGVHWTKLPKALENERAKRQEAEKRAQFAEYRARDLQAERNRLMADTSSLRKEAAVLEEKVQQLQEQFGSNAKANDDQIRTVDLAALESAATCCGELSSSLRKQHEQTTAIEKQTRILQELFAARVASNAVLTASNELLVSEPISGLASASESRTALCCGSTGQAYVAKDRDVHTHAVAKMTMVDESSFDVALASEYDIAVGCDPARGIPKPTAACIRKKDDREELVLPKEAYAQTSTPKQRTRNLPLRGCTIFRVPQKSSQIQFASQAVTSDVQKGPAQFVACDSASVVTLATDSNIAANSGDDGNATAARLKHRQHEKNNIHEAWMAATIARLNDNATRTDLISSMTSSLDFDSTRRSGGNPSAADKQHVEIHDAIKEHGTDCVAIASSETQATTIKSASATVPTLDSGFVENETAAREQHVQMHDGVKTAVAATDPGSKPITDAPCSASAAASASDCDVVVTGENLGNIAEARKQYLHRHNKTKEESVTAAIASSDSSTAAVDEVSAAVSASDSNVVAMYGDEEQAISEEKSHVHLQNGVKEESASALVAGSNSNAVVFNSDFIVTSPLGPSAVATSGNGNNTVAPAEFLVRKHDDGNDIDSPREVLAAARKQYGRMRVGVWELTRWPSYRAMSPIKERSIFPGPRGVTPREDEDMYELTPALLMRWLLEEEANLQTNWEECLLDRQLVDMLNNATVRIPWLDADIDETECIANAAAFLLHEYRLSADFQDTARRLLQWLRRCGQKYAEPPTRATLKCVDKECDNGDAYKHDCNTIELTARLATTGEILATLHLQSSDTLESFRSVITKKTGECDSFQFFYRSRPLEGGRTIEEIGLPHGAFVDVVFSASPRESLVYTSRRRVLTTSRDLAVKIWTADFSECVQMFPEQGGAVRAVAFSPNGRDVAAGCGNGIAQLLDAFTGECVCKFIGHAAEIRDLVFSPDGCVLATCSDDRAARLWDMNATCTMELKGHEGPVWSVDFAPDGTELVTSSLDRTVRLWNTAMGKCRMVLTGHTDCVCSAAFSPNGGIVASGSWDGAVLLWDAVTGDCVRHLYRHCSQVRCICFDPGGVQVVAGLYDGLVTISRVEDGTTVHSLQGHEDCVHSVACSSDNLLIATASDDRAARVWRAEDGCCIAVLTGHNGFVYSAVFSPDSQLLVTGGMDRCLRMWCMGKARCTSTMSVRAEAVCAASISPSDSKVVIACWDGVAKIRNFWGEGPTQSLIGHCGAVWSVAFSPCSRYVVTGSNDATAKVWNADTLRCMQTLVGHSGSVWKVAFSTSGTWIGTASQDRTAGVWDATTGIRQLTLSGHSDCLKALAFSSDDQRLITGSDDTTAIIWSLCSSWMFSSGDRFGDAILTLAAHRDCVRSVAYAPSNTSVVTGSNDFSARLWGLPTGECLHVFDGHLGFVNTVAVDENSVLTGSWDGVVKVWNAKTGACTSSLSGHEDVVTSVDFLLL